MEIVRIQKMSVVNLILMAVLILIPVQAAFGGVGVKTINATLPADGTDVAFTLKGTKNMLLYEILVDTNPTLDEGLCTPVDLSCVDSDFRVKSLKVGGSYVKPGINEGEDMGKNDKIALRPLLAKSQSDAHIPAKGGQKIVLVLDTQNGNNDVKVKLTFGFEGGGRSNLPKKHWISRDEPIPKRLKEEARLGKMRRLR